MIACFLCQHWVTSRQMRFEGGFQGRCNKLVDGCYSFWQAGLLPLVHRALHAKGKFELQNVAHTFPTGHTYFFFGLDKYAGVQ